jgi:hypothetical protein
MYLVLIDKASPDLGKGREKTFTVIRNVFDVEEEHSRHEGEHRNRSRAP